jgi:DNA-binding beta-propeller fold protein YncE
MNVRSPWLLLLAAPLAIGCDSNGDALPTSPPKEVTKVASGGFTSPTDAVASLDGSEFYFAAFTELGQGAVFRTPSMPGSTAEMMASAPLAMPIGLVLSCDGNTLFVADAGADSGGIYAMANKGGELTDLNVTGMRQLGGLAMGPDCKTLFATGRTDDDQPALFRIAVAGGAATAISTGEPLVSPTGLHVDGAGTAWVMDHLAQGANGPGVLFAIPKGGGKVSEVASDLRMGTPGGVSLTAGGGTAVMPTKDANGMAQLTSVSIKTGEVTQLAAPEIVDPAGLRTAREAGVFAVVDSEGGAIYRAQ